MNDDPSGSLTYWANKWAAEDRLEASLKRAAERMIKHHGPYAGLADKKKVALSRQRGGEASRQRAIARRVSSQN